MWAYACELPPGVYREWLEDRSTMKHARLGFLPWGLDEILRSVWPWVAMTAWAVFSIYCANDLFWELEILVSVNIITLCFILDLCERQLPIPQSLHFICFGMAYKFRHTDWNPAPVVPLMLCVCCLGMGWSIPIVVVSLTQAVWYRRTYNKRPI